MHDESDDSQPEQRFSSILGTDAAAATQVTATSCWSKVAVIWLSMNWLTLAGLPCRSLPLAFACLPACLACSTADHDRASGLEHPCKMGAPITFWRICIHTPQVLRWILGWISRQRRALDLLTATALSCRTSVEAGSWMTESTRPPTDSFCESTRLYICFDHAQLCKWAFGLCN